MPIYISLRHKNGLQKYIKQNMKHYETLEFHSMFGLFWIFLTWHLEKTSDEIQRIITVSVVTGFIN